jgi:acetyl esterase/lipase
MAGLEHFKVVSVDYRMPPEAYFPVAIDDVLTVYKALQRTNATRRTWRSSAPQPAERSRWK